MKLLTALLLLGGLTHHVADTLWCNSSSLADGLPVSAINSRLSERPQAGDEEIPKDCNRIDIRQLRVVDTEGLVATIATEIAVRGEEDYDKAIVRFIIDDYYPVGLGVKKLKPGVEERHKLEFPSEKNFFHQRWILYAHFQVFSGDKSDKCMESIKVEL